MRFVGLKLTRPKIVSEIDSIETDENFTSGEVCRQL